MQTNQQKFATSAFKQVQTIKSHDEEYRQKYGSMSHKLPLLIHTAGLAQALAFVQAKNKVAYNDLLNHLAETVQWPGATNGEKLTEKSRSEHLDGYILLTRRVTSALIWYKRFAESELGVSATQDIPEGGEE
ncbi:MAG: type III-B CRISPR module-associated protein Cmr5 [Anaerolineae bacterium]|nr:type III-B CRISPR module-associated protein Cmr5 [Anaerolineae bacterium]